MIDRTATARALAKAQAYADCGKLAQARAWAAELVNLLEAEDILIPSHRRDIHSALRVAAELERAA